jgi:hypothetical protein
MSEFIVKQYYLNQDPPKEIETTVSAKTAVEAIRSIEHWRHAYQFTHLNRDSTIQAHTQNGDGRNGCHAELKT